jgi:hypothetical protein
LSIQKLYYLLLICLT